MPHKIPDCKIAYLAALLWLVPCSVTLAATNTIVAGKSIGQIRLGEASKEALAPLSAYTSGDTAMGRTWNVWISHSPASHSPASSGISGSKPYELDVLTIRDPSGLRNFIEQIRITSPWFRTSKGIHIGSSFSAVRAAFPGARQLMDARQVSTLLSPGQALALYDDVDQGITFEFIKSNAAASKPRKARISLCLAILVHPKHTGVQNEYAPWYIQDR